MNEIAHRATDYNASQLALIKRTVAADCNNDEFDLFCEVCKRVGLDPFRKQIYAVVYNKNKPDKRKMAIITGIDGFRAVAARNGNYRPDENEPEIVIDETLISDTNPKGILKAAVTVHRYGPDGQWHPVKGWAYWEEFAPLKEIWAENEKTGKRYPSGNFELDKTSNWFRMPHVMLPKCAEAQALRKGWPEDLSGVYAPEEMAQAHMQDLNASEAVEAFQSEQRLKQINAADCVTFDMQDGESGLEAIPLGKVADRLIDRVNRFDDAASLDFFCDYNRAGLKEFWARQKADALEVKKAIDERKAHLSKEEAA